MNACIRDFYSVSLRDKRGQVTNRDKMNLTAKLPQLRTTAKILKAMKLAAKKQGVELKDWRREAYREKLERSLTNTSAA